MLENWLFDPESSPLVPTVWIFVTHVSFHTNIVMKTGFKIPKFLFKFWNSPRQELDKAGLKKKKNLKNFVMFMWKFDLSQIFMLFFSTLKYVLHTKSNSGIF